MSKIIQCESCYNAEDGEQLYLFDGHQYCSICLTDKLLNAGINVFSFGDFATSDRKSKDQRIAELEKQLAIRDRALKYACKYCSFKTGGYPEPIFFLEQAERASRRSTEKIGGEMKNFIGWAIIILSALASIFAGVMQIVLSYQLFGVFVEAFIPHWSCWFFFGIITAFLGVLLLMEEKK